MGSPFPGMDPYLEAYWGDVHTRMSLYACDQLTEQLPDDLHARVEEYLAVETDEGTEVVPGAKYLPDVKIAEQTRTELAERAQASKGNAVAVAEPVIVPLVVEAQTLHSIHIYDRHSGNRVITAIEFLSPANKVGTACRQEYRRKLRNLLEGGVSVVEIDLVRQGGYVLIPPQLSLPPDCRGAYRISVVRGWRPDLAEVYRVPLRQRLPAIAIPLRPSDRDVVLDLQPLLERSYTMGRYGRAINYRVDPDPPLQGDDAVWGDQLLREQGKR